MAGGLFTTKASRKPLSKTFLRARQGRGAPAYGSNSRTILCWLMVSTEKNYSQPKSSELCFIWWEFLGLQALAAASQVTLGELLRGTARLYRSFATKGK